MFDLNVKITNFRFKIKKELYLSKYFNIKLRNPNEEERKLLNSIIFNSVKEIIKTTTQDKIIQLFKCYKVRQRANDLFKKVKTEDINLYFDLIRLFYIVTIYNKEFKLKKENFIFEDKNIYDAIDNFIKNIVLLDTSNKQIIINTIASYYNLSPEQESHQDYLITFYKGIMNIYNKLYPRSDEESACLLLTINITPDLYSNLVRITNDCTLKIQMENQKKFIQNIHYNLIDLFLQNSEDNPKIFIFLVELFEERHFGRTEVLNYITFFDLILTHKPNQNKFNVEDSIFQQFIQKISACVSLTGDIKNENDLKWLKSELKLMYNYRSDILHGNFNKIIEDLEKFLNIPYYREEIDRKYSFYSQKTMAIEELILERLNYFFKIIFKFAAEKPLFIKALK